MKIALIAFTQKGCRLGETLTEELSQQGDSVSFSACMGEQKTPLQAWTAASFGTAQALVFVGAAGIATRAIAPHLVSKTTDPAVVVLDDNGRFCISLLSGHLGGANSLSQRIAAMTGAQAVITTATDGNEVFAVDSWAKAQGLRIANPQQIKIISAKLLAGKPVGLRCDFPISGALPKGLFLAENENFDLYITVKQNALSDVLRLIPPIVVVGIGCRKGMQMAKLEAAFDRLLAKNDVDGLAVCSAASICIKAGEPGILAFCGLHNLPFCTYTAEELNAVSGQFAASAFVQEVTGTGNVCERSAAVASGGGPCLHKETGDGVTMALALADYTVKF